ncbi:MAG TPA: hypothetical protein VN578_11625 [Candidatus Binatia bacterium]|nr:hypothetical protein [Candidatus Binatia bacterium]
MLRAQSRPLGFIIAVQACLVAATLISDAVMSSKIPPRLVIASVLMTACCGSVTALVTGFVVGLSAVFGLGRHLPDFFAVCALVVPFVGFMAALEKAYLLKSSSRRLVEHISIFVCSAMMSFISWFVLSMLAFGILLLVGAG